jgi:glycosyltransferase involved in cell wall biosynthesis
MANGQSGFPKVLHIGVEDGILHPANSGRRRVRRDMAERIGRADDITYSPRQHGYEPTILSDRAAVYPVHARTKLHFLRDAFRIGCRLHEERGYDLVRANDPMGSGIVGYRLKRRYGLPLLIKCHSDYYSSGAWRSESLRYRFFDYPLSIWLLRRADHVQVVSPRIAEDVARLGVDPDRITIAPTPVQTELFEPGPDTLERYGAGRLLFTGRLAKQKDIPTLLRAAHILADSGRRFRLTIVGSGPLGQRLTALARELNVEQQVEFIAHVPREELTAYYQQSSVFVIPSVHEALGKVIIEAGLCGLPIVGTDVGDIAWNVVDGETGLLVPPRDPEALAGAVARLLDDPTLARTLGQNAQRLFRERWRCEDMIDTIAALLKLIFAHK